VVSSESLGIHCLAQARAAMEGLPLAAAAAFVGITSAQELMRIAGDGRHEHAGYQPLFVRLF
jgi:hypothetical protein